MASQLVFNLNSPNEEVRKESNQIVYQLRQLACLFGFGMIVLLTELVNPNFFQYPYLYGGSIDSIAQFWPLFIYGAIMAFLAAMGRVPTKHDEQLLVLGATTSVLAGVWEELGFRFIYVCTAMISIYTFNFFLSGVMGVVPAVILIALSIFFFTEAENRHRSTASKLFLRAIAVCLIGLGLFIGYSIFMGANPRYWFYEYLIIPVVNVVTLGFFHSIFYGDYPRLLVFGMIAANALFRDGHKYQGWYGIVNSWVVGFILMYATLKYGLFTAIAIHAWYDLQFDFIRYTLRKMKS